MSEIEKKIDKKIKPRRNLTKIIFLLISYIIVATIVWNIAIKRQADPTVQQEQLQKEMEAIVESVGNLMILPADETPQIAVIKDVAALKKAQDFFRDAEDGDNILVYIQARKAIIYRASINKIVNVALNVGPVADETNTKPISASKTTDTATTSTDKNSSSTESN